jgi:hypothetical protein
VEGRVEGSGFHLQDVPGIRADRLGDAVAVPRPPLQGLEDEQVEGALEELDAGLVARLHVRLTMEALYILRM